MRGRTRRIAWGERPAAPFWRPPGVDSNSVLSVFNGLQVGKVPLVSPEPPTFCQSEGAVSRAPVYQILWARGFRATTISEPGFNLFKPLRRHFRADSVVAVRPSRAAIPATETPRFKIDDCLGDLRWDGGVETNRERPRNFGKFVDM